MRRALVSVLAAALACTSALAAPADVPLGKLPDAARPTAYRLDMTILPDQPRFSGHVEIDAAVKAQTSSLYLHGRDLAVTVAQARVGGRTIAAKWTQVDPTGVVRLDFASPLPAGAVTLAFDYSGAFGQNPAGLYHLNIANQWYSWSQFESIDARSAFPSFDEPGFKTPFTVKVTTRPGYTVVSNAPEAAVATAAGAGGPLEVHSFQPTKPLPTYLVALVTGPFKRVTGAVPPADHRAAPLPLGVVATQPQAGKMDYALAESPRIVTLLERYFGQAFPFPKLDQIGSPVMPGAMENAGADIYGDGILLLDPARTTTRQKQEFGMVVAHELSHQWFGDLVSPAWWDDIWLNESFANWMGFRIGNEWRPELNIGVNAIDEAFAAMNTDALEVGRPIHQPIPRNDQIDDAFDSITYGKGGQVVAMIAAYLGDEKFRDGVRLHLSRHAYGNATTEQFFQALADAAHDPRLVQAMESFVNQQGVPLVSFQRQGSGWLATQSRYAYLGSTPPAERWSIPLCVRQGDQRRCQLLDQASMTVPLAGGQPIMPNAGGAGYYRFDMPAADWAALIKTAPSLPAGEALALDDSLWASFRAGRLPAALLISAMRSLADNRDSNAAVDGGERLSGLKAHGLVAADALPAYRALMAATYGPRLKAIGFDPKAGAFAGDDPDRQKLRTALVQLLVGEADDKALSAALRGAAERYLAGDNGAIDPGLLATGLSLHVAAGGLPAARALMERALTSEDAVFRPAALGAIASTGKPDVTQWLLTVHDPRLRPIELTRLLGGLVSRSESRAAAIDWVIANYARVTTNSGIFLGSRLQSIVAAECSAARADEIAAKMGPVVKAQGAATLNFDRAVETIRHCGVLKDAKGAELSQAIKAG